MRLVLLALPPGGVLARVYPRQLLRRRPWLPASASGGASAVRPSPWRRMWRRWARDLYARQPSTDCDRGQPVRHRSSCRSREPEGASRGDLLWTFLPHWRRAQQCLCRLCLVLPRVALPRARPMRSGSSCLLDFTPSMRRRRASRLRNRRPATACRRRNSTACSLPRAPLSLLTSPARPCGLKRAPSRALRPARVPAVPQRSPH